MLGESLSENQYLILEKCGAMNLVIMTDNDFAGRNAAKNIVSKCKNLFNIIIPQYPNNIKDLGEMKNQNIKNMMKNYDNI